LIFVAIDEADLLLSYGLKEDLEQIFEPTNNFVPSSGIQGCLMSATLSEDVEGVKGLILRNPVRKDIDI
jgi:ATP-dependent RNA helicase DDX56/DBP9